MRRLAASFALALCAAPFGVYAEADAKHAAEDVVRSALAVFAAGDRAAIKAKLPPRQLRVLATAAGTDVDGLLAAHAKQITASLALVDPGYLAVLPELTEVSTTPSGREYVTVWGIEYWRTDDNNLHKLTWPVIAFQEEGTWYFTQTRKATDVLALRQAYPDFLDVTLPKRRVERVLDNKLPDNLKEAD